MVTAHRAADILAALREVPEAGAPSIALHAALLEIQAEVEAGDAARSIAVPAALPSTETARRIAAGQALLADLAEVCDPAWPAFGRLVDRLADVIGLHRPDLAPGLAGGLEAMDAGVRGFVLLQAGRAFLRPVAAALAPLVNEAEWGRGSCPVCGGEPDMAALEPGGGERRLLCGRCDAEWGFQRIGCPFCGLDDPEGLTYHAAGAWRLYVCAGCQRYLKTVDRRERAGACLPVERIASEALDWSARQAGYRGGSAEGTGSGAACAEARARGGV